MFPSPPFHHGVTRRNRVARQQQQLTNGRRYRPGAVKTYGYVAAIAIILYAVLRVAIVTYRGQIVSSGSRSWVSIVGFMCHRSRLTVQMSY